ncbi:MAG: hypothetical protein JNM93_12015 [Bacteriovoracaceae bacterium]|nr:hypothetical protein [Bacteriovoracaceae bacterium]
MYHFLILMLSITSVWGQQVCGDIPSAQLVTRLQKFGFKCDQISSEGCDYHECEGQIPQYSQPIRIAIPAATHTLRIHFHGHRLQLLPQYDKNLESMIKSFGLSTRLCKNNETVIFPGSIGNCKNYDQELKEKSQIQSFVKAVNSLFDNALIDLPLHLSAHSGGGRVLSRFLSEQVAPNQVTIYDGIYSEETKKIVENWLTSSGGKFRSVAASGSDLKPFRHAESLRLNLNQKWTSSSVKIKQGMYQVHSNGQIEFLSTPYVDLRTHYQVVSDVWP